MKSASNYARIINFLNANKCTGIEDGCEEVLAYVLFRQEQDIPTMITNLVQSLMFGTGPTVHRKVNQLNGAGLIKLVKSASDGRAKHLELSAKGISYLEDRHAKLQSTMRRY